MDEFLYHLSLEKSYLTIWFTSHKQEKSNSDYYIKQHHRGQGQKTTDWDKIFVTCNQIYKELLNIKNPLKRTKIPIKKRQKTWIPNPYMYKKILKRPLSLWKEFMSLIIIGDTRETAFLTYHTIKKYYNFCWWGYGDTYNHAGGISEQWHNPLWRENGQYLTKLLLCLSFHLEILLLRI